MGDQHTAVEPCVSSEINRIFCVASYQSHAVFPMYCYGMHPLLLLLSYILLLISRLSLFLRPAVWSRRTSFPCTRTLRTSTRGTCTRGSGTTGTGPSAASPGPRWTLWSRSPTTTTGPSSECLGPGVRLPLPCAKRTARLHVGQESAYLDECVYLCVAWV